jgi:hypothetical protein
MPDVLTPALAAPLLALLGIVLIVFALRALRLRDGRRSWTGWALTYLRVFRGVVVGLCLIGAAWGWAERIDWLLAASLCVGIGEWLESSYYLVVLEWGRRRRLTCWQGVESADAL